MDPTHKQNLIKARQVNLAEQHDLRERLTQLATDETQLLGAITILSQIEEAEKAKPAQPE